MILSLLHTQQHFIGHKQVSLSVLNVFFAPGADESSLKGRWVLELRHDNTLFFAPVVEHLIFVSGVFFAFLSQEPVDVLGHFTSLLVLVQLRLQSRLS